MSMRTDRAELLTDRVRAALATEPSLREVRMFGGLSFMINDQILVAVRGDGGLLVRIDPDRNAELIACLGAGPAEMGPGRTMGPSWIAVEHDTVADEAQLSFWISAARARNPDRPIRTEART